MDAGATSVGKLLREDFMQSVELIYGNETEINFRDYGVLSVEVKDNGNGIDETDWSSIGCVFVRSLRYANILT